MQNTITLLNNTLFEYGESINQINLTIDGLDEFIIVHQAPTTENNYTWYKKYKNGFVEQGGNITSSANIMTVLLLVEMSNTQYQTFAIVQTIGNYFIFCPPNTENSIQVRITSGSDF